MYSKEVKVGSQNRYKTALKNSFFLLLRAIPLLIMGIFMSAALSALLPADTVSAMIGSSSGIKGVFIAAFAGIFIPGEPFFGLPIAAALQKSGAGTGSLVAFITSWSLMSFNLYPTEIALVGWRLTLVRTLSCITTPIAAGLIAYSIF